MMESTGCLTTSWHMTYTHGTAAEQIKETLRKDTYLCSVPSGAAAVPLQPMKKMSISTAFPFGIFPCHCELAHKNKI